MKRYIPAIVVAMVLFPAVCFSAFIIELDNGHKYITSKWWKKGGQIMFYQYGGVMGLDQDKVKNIEKTSGPVPEGQGRTPIKTEAEADSAPEAGQAPSPAPLTVEQIEEMKSENRLLDNENIAAIAAVNKAKKSGDEAAIKKARENLSQVKRKIQTLREKVEKAHNGKLPDWW